MSYSETLDEMIKKSGLSLRQLAEKLKEYNVEIDSSYISKLKTGNQKPKDNITIALAKACGGDPDELLIEAYMEKAPNIIQSFVKKMASNIRDAEISIFAEDAPEEFGKFAKENAHLIPLRSVIKKYVKEEAKQPQYEDKTFFVTNNEGRKIQTIIAPSETPSFALKMEDDSMDPLIPKDALIKMADSKELISGDIVVVTFKNKTYAIRRYIPFEDRIILVPENKVFETVAYDKLEVNIVGKVTAITITKEL